MVKQGTMINVKEGLGIGLAIFSINYFYPMAFMDSLQFLYLPVMIISAYFLIKSGSQR